MGFFKEAEQVVARELAPPTLEQRAERANRVAQVAIDTFVMVANDLEGAAETLQTVADEAFAEAERLAEQGRAATKAADKHLIRAGRLRDLLA